MYQLRPRRLIGRAIAAILNDFYRDQKRPAFRLFLHLGLHHLEDVPCDTLTRAKIYDVWLINLAAALFVNGKDVLQKRIVVIEDAGVVQVFFYPSLDVFQLAEIDHKTAFIQFVATKGKRETPIVPVNLSAMPVVAMLAVSERDVRIGLFTGEH